MPLVIVLTGPSCSGKTSLARALQTVLPEPALHVEADRVFPTLPGDHPRWSDPQHHRTLALALHRSITTWSQAGFNLIIDGALPYGHPELRADRLRVLEPFAPRLVGVTCATQTLTAREPGPPRRSTRLGRRPSPRRERRTHTRRHRRHLNRRPRTLRAFRIRSAAETGKRRSAPQLNGSPRPGPYYPEVTQRIDVP